MKILSIETSCDETAVSLVEATGNLTSPSFSVLGNALYSQIAIHKEYGGVYPMLAKREHAKNLSPLLQKTLKDAGAIPDTEATYSEESWNEIQEILKRENGLYENFRELFGTISKPDIDVIAVTSGPGLEPALWVGISFATALGTLWNIPVLPTNHMEGHVASILIKNTDERTIEFPAIAVLISGGHTEIVKMEHWGRYEIIGHTVDDAVGEAYDKVARLLSLPYPGGPEISRLSELARAEGFPKIATLPRPMIHSKDLNFSFSGLKTAVLYYIRDHFTENPTDIEKADLAREFEDAVIEVLMKKTKEALIIHDAKTLIIAGGVIANTRIREHFVQFEKEFSGLTVIVPDRELATDNSLMIAAAAYTNILQNPDIIKRNYRIIAQGNLHIGGRQ